MIDCLHLFHLHNPGVGGLGGLLQNLPQVVLSAVQHLKERNGYYKVTENVCVRVKCSRLEAL